MSGRPRAPEVQGWAGELGVVAERLGRHFARSEPRRRAVGCLRGLLSDTRRKNGWQLAEYLGRGHVSDIVLPQGGFLPKQNAPGTPVAQGSAFLREHAKTMQMHETVW